MSGVAELVDVDALGRVVPVRIGQRFSGLSEWRGRRVGSVLYVPFIALLALLICWGQGMLGGGRLNKRSWSDVREPMRINCMRAS